MTGCQVHHCVDGAGGAAGTDLARFADDARIELLVVLPGHLPR